MHISTTGMALARRTTHSGRMLVVLMALTLLSLLGLLGLVRTGQSHAHWASAPTGRWLAPTPTQGGGGGDPHSTAATNGDLQIGG